MKKLFRQYLKPLFFGTRTYRVLIAIVALFVISFAVSWLFVIAQGILLLFFVIVITDFIILFSQRNLLTAKRMLPDRFSNGDENPVVVLIENNYPFNTTVEILEEVPVQFQLRSHKKTLLLRPGAHASWEYTLKPVERGEYYFGNINLYAKSPLQLVVRRIIISHEQIVKVFPSFFQMRKYELMAHTTNLTDAGSRRIRKLGHSLEFEQIKDYVAGDDIRSINWKATARKGQLMVNSFTDERSQQIYCVIDKGRVMKMPFEGMTLLDYAINACLMLSKVALIRQDKAGLISFADTIGTFIPADRRQGQMTNIVENLYNQQTQFKESDYERLFTLISTRISQRSLLILFTNFESHAGLERQLPFIRKIASRHLVLVVFFENTELKELIDTPAHTIEDIYQKTIAEKFAYEKRLMVKEFQKHGVLAILTTPEQVTINTVNKYLELKARQAI
ncbi:MAG TPA: DUF58 domain-containing protein [Parasegetibacter sp.]